MTEKSMLCDCDVIHAHIVDKVEEEMPHSTKLYKLYEFIKAFGDLTRIKILCALDINEMCVCDLAVFLSMTKSAVSHQLKYLKEANLVKYRREGKMIFYFLCDDHVKDIIEKCCEHIDEKNED